jgi:fibronectin type 3 domain-containing protein
VVLKFIYYKLIVNSMNIKDLSRAIAYSTVVFIVSILLPSSVFASGALSATPTSGNAPLTVSFSVSNVLNTTTTAVLGYGDGSNSGVFTLPPCAASESGCSLNMGHTYESAGTYLATLYPYSTCASGGLRCLLASQILSFVKITVLKGVTNPSVPPVPTGVSATAGSCGTGNITVSWNGSTGATSYTLVDNGSVIYSGSATSYTDTGLSSGSANSYAVIASNATGPSAASAAVSATAPGACSSGGGGTGSSLVVYGSSLQNGFVDGSWANPRNLENTSPVYPGSTNSISVTYSDFSALRFEKAKGVSTSGYTALNFAVNGGSQQGEPLIVQITMGSQLGPVVPIASYCTGGQIPTNAWTLCSIPLSVLGAANTTLTAITLMENAANPMSPMYFDQIALGAPPAAGPSIVSINPISGPIGTAVTLTGYGFTWNNTILLNGNLIIARNVPTSSSEPTVCGNSTNGCQGGMEDTLKFAIPASVAPNCSIGVACPQYMEILQPGSYTISVENSNGTSNAVTFTITGGTTTTPPSAPTGLTAVAGSCGTGSINVSWNASSGATSYTLYRSGVKIYSGSNLTFSDTGLAASASYAYTVTASNSAGTSSYAGTTPPDVSAPGACTVIPSVPTNLKAVAGSCSTGSISISWNASSGTTSYTLYRNNTQIYNGNNLYFTDTDLAAGVSYEYSVTAKNSAGTSGPAATTPPQTTAPNACVTIPPTPTGIIASAGACSTGSIRISWNTSSGATSYVVRRNGTQIYSGTNLTYTDTGLTAGTSYAYTVGASNSAGTSALGGTSPAQTAAPGACVTIPPAPTNLSAVAGSCGTGSITVSWKASSGATSYTLYRSGLKVYSGNGLTFSDTGLSAGTSYEYTVTASNSTGTSAATGTTPPATSAPNACGLSLATQIQAAQTTAGSSAACHVIDVNTSGSDDGFYWEIGNANGIMTDSAGQQAAGSVQPVGTVGTNYTRNTVMLYASASKLISASYILEEKAVDENGTWVLPSQYVPYLNFTSGYTNMVDSCPYVAGVPYTSQFCMDLINPNNGQTYGTLEAANIGHFYYNSGHLQVLAGGGSPTLGNALGLQNDGPSQFTSSILSAFATHNVNPGFSYFAPWPAGAGQGSTAEYATFLQGILQPNNPLVMRSFLNPASSDPYAVCTNPKDPSSLCVSKVANYTPIPERDWDYGVGHWIEDDPRYDDDGAYSSPGKFGYYPWIDATKTYYGVVARYDNGSSNPVQEGYESALCGETIRKAFMTGVVQS